MLDGLWEQRVAWRCKMEVCSGRAKDMAEQQLLPLLHKKAFATKSAKPQEHQSPTVLSHPLPPLKLLFSLLTPFVVNVNRRCSEMLFTQDMCSHFGARVQVCFLRIGDTEQPRLLRVAGSSVDSGFPVSAGVLIRVVLLSPSSASPVSPPLPHLT